jgi:hypothetical protein
VVVANIQNPNEQTYAAVEAMQLPIAAEMMGIFDAFKKISVKQSIVNSKECLGIVILAIISETTQHLDSARTKKQFSYPPSVPYETLTGVLRERGGSAVDDLARLMPTGFSDLCTYLPAVRHYIPDADKKDEVSQIIYELPDTIDKFRSGYRKDIVLAADRLDTLYELLAPVKQQLDADAHARENMPKLVQALDGFVDVLGAFVKAQSPTSQRG